MKSTPQNDRFSSKRPPRDNRMVGAVGARWAGSMPGVYRQAFYCFTILPRR
jgi:hypothetical protein